MPGHGLLDGAPPLFKNPAMARPHPRLAGLVAAVLLLGTAAPAAADEAGQERPRIYKWVDRNGVAHYTTDPDRIPGPLRNRIQSLERGERTAAPAPATRPETPQATGPGPEPAATTAPRVAPVPAPEGLEPPAAAAREPAAAEPGTPAPEGAVPGPAPPSARPDDWVRRDAVPRVPSGAESWLESDADLTPAQEDALATEREALDARIAELEAEVRRDEDVLKDLISDPDTDADTPLFDRPAFLEISQRLPELQSQLDALRSQRERLERP